MKICSFMTFATLASMALAGCGNSDISKVKAMKLDANPTYTIGQAFDNRKVCDSVAWDEITDTRARKLVEYRCTFKGVQSGQEANPIVKIGEVVQWSIGDDGTPALAFEGFESTHQDGTVVDASAIEGAIDQIAVKDTAATAAEYNVEYSDIQSIAYIRSLKQQ